MSWVSIFGPENVNFIEETDAVARDADFTLFYRPVETAKHWTSQPFAHWAVVVEYKSEPKKVFTFEAGKQKNGPLVEATRSSEYPDRSKGKFIRLGTRRISPKQLVHYARCVSLNGQLYHLVFQNCQAWCKEFCGEIAKDFLDDQFWDVKNLLGTVVAAGVALLGSSVSAAVSSSVGNADSTNNGH